MFRDVQGLKACRIVVESLGFRVLFSPAGLGFCSPPESA